MNKKQIFVVDDNEDLREEFKALLKNDYEVFCFCDGSEAWEEINGKNHLPHLLLTDWKMPKMNGLNLIELVKSKFSFPVIMMSGDVPSYCPADCFIAKSSKTSFFLKEIERLIEKQPLF